MEDQNHLELIARIRACHPQVKLDYSHDTLSGLYQAQIRDPQNSIKGFGESLSYYDALVKSYGEYVERWCFRHSGARSSNGFAAYPNILGAQVRARGELIERDALLMSWMGALPPYWLDESEIKPLLNSEGVSVFKLIEFQALHGLDYRLGIIAKTAEYITMVAAIKAIDDKEVFALDSVSRTTLPDVLNSSLINLLSLSSIVRAKLKKGVRPLNVSQVARPMDHMDFYLTQSAPSWFWQSSNEIAVFPEFEVTLEHIEIPIDLALDVCVVHARSEEAQQLYFGVTKDEEINLKRYECIFSSRKIANYDVHPLA